MEHPTKSDENALSRADSLVNAAYLAAANHQQPSANAVIRVYAASVSVGPAYPSSSFRPSKHRTSTTSGGKRGKIKSFSRAARRRLIRLLSQVDQSQLGNPVFLTLTYHDNWHDRDIQRDREIFLKRVGRAYPGCRWIWRLDYQRRGAPHFHIILWPVVGEDIQTQSQRERLATIWHEVVDPDNPTHAQYGAQVVPLRDQQGVKIYMSKLGRITSDEEERDVGRRWGSSRDLPTLPQAEFEVPEETATEARRLLRHYLNRQRDGLGRRRRSCSKYARTVVTGHASHVLVDNPAFMMRWLFEQADAKPVLMDTRIAWDESADGPLS